MLGWREAFWLCCLGYLVWVPVGNSDVVRSWGLAATGLKLGGLVGLWLGRLECQKGMAAKGVLKNIISLCVFLPWISGTEEAELKLRLSPALQKRQLPSSWSLSVFSVVSDGFSVTCSPSENSWGTSLCPQRELLVQHQGSSSWGRWFGGTWQCWVCGWLDDLKALIQPKLFCDSLI